MSIELDRGKIGERGEPLTAAPVVEEARRRCRSRRRWCGSFADEPRTSQRRQHRAFSRIASLVISVPLVVQLLYFPGSLTTSASASALPRTGAQPMTIFVPSAVTAMEWIGPKSRSAP